MIVLDTNVVSEPLRPKPDGRVLAWLDRQSPETLYLTTISVAELRTGIELLPAGKRRAQLHDALEGQVLPLFAGRLLSFDVESAAAFARVYAKSQTAGNTMDFADCAIAAIAARHRFMIATRNSKDFRGSGVALLNPWEATES